MMLSHTVKAALWMLGAVFSFSAMAVAGREMAAELDTFEIMMYRSLVGIVIVLAVGQWAGTLKQVNGRNMSLHIGRNISHFIGQNLWFFAVAIIPFAQLLAFEFSTPLWVALVAPFFLGERLTRVRLLAVLLGFIGILLVAKPTALTLDAGIIAAALCAIGFAGSLIMTKLLARTETTTCILFWLTVIQAILGIICAGYDGDITLPSLQTLPLVIVVGCSGLLAHYCLTTALQLAPAVMVAPMDFLRLPLLAIVGYLFYNEGLDIWIIAGAALVIAANIWNMSAQHKSSLA